MAWKVLYSEIKFHQKLNILLWYSFWLIIGIILKKTIWLQIFFSCKNQQCIEFQAKHKLFSSLSVTWYEIYRFLKKTIIFLCENNIIFFTKRFHKIDHCFSYHLFFSFLYDEIYIQNDSIVKKRWKSCPRWIFFFNNFKKRRERLFIDD